MNEIEQSEFMIIVSRIDGNAKLSSAEKAHAIANLWTSIEIGDISTQAQYDEYIKLRSEIEAKALLPSPSLDFTALIRSEERHAFLQSQDGQKWFVLNGAIFTWEDAHASGSRPR